MKPDDAIAGGGTDGRPTGARIVLTGAMLLVAVVFLGLGTWQVQRLFWKLDLIERVEARIGAEPVPAPARPDWPGVTAAADEYRKVTATGTFDHARETLVQAVTELGAGFWVLTPLIQTDGGTILVNRGFLPADKRDPAFRVEGATQGPARVTGLLRMSEPGGAFLRSNDPAGGRWYSRDVAAIASAQGLQNVAPYFIDADATPNPGGLPVGGMTVVRFRNPHLVYAITWYIMAAMSLGAAFMIQRKRSAGDDNH